MATPGDNEYYAKGDNGGIPFTDLYSNLYDWNPPKPVKYKDDKGQDQLAEGNQRKAPASLFNRYSLFLYNSVQSPPKGADKPEPFADAPNRRGLSESMYRVQQNPTASNIISWSREGGNNAIDYDWPDFLWCKNYGMIPNNYMITLRRFPIPAMDDLTSPVKNPAPDISRLITWLDGETNTWESVGLKWSHKLKYKALESEVQKVNVPDQAGNEGGAFGGTLGNVIKAASWSTQPGSDKAALGNPNAATFDPYQNSNAVWGPIDVIKSMMVRDTGLEFEQTLTLTFEYELRSIDGINSKVAMIDLLSNVMVCTMNRGNFWGGDVRWIGGNPRQIKPLGDTSKLAKGDYGGYLSSLVTNVTGRLDALTGGQGFSIQGIANAAKNVMGNVMANIVGGGLNNMGRPGIAAVNSLLTGEDTGEWHVTVGNPANPIMSIGNLILENTEFAFDGALGPDDFPTKLKVICTLKPGRPRDRTDIIAMFHRNGRTYLTSPPSVTKYAGNVPKGGKNGGSITKGEDRNRSFDPSKMTPDGMNNSLLQKRFPNHVKEGAIVTESAKSIF